MSKLVWDVIGEHYYETGTDHGVLFVKKPAGQTGYEAGVAWNGLTAVTESPSGADVSDQYADNIKYLSLRAAETFGGTIEAFTYPDEFAVCDGSYAITPGVVIGQQSRRPFAFSFRTKVGNDTAGDEFGYKLHIVYNATASPAERSYATINDSPEPITLSWEFDTTPVAFKNDTYKPTALITIDSTKADKTKLDQLEALLYGTENAESSLPTPDEVIAIFAGTGGKPAGATGGTGGTGGTSGTGTGSTGTP